MTEFTQGVCADGAAILKDGVMLTIEEIIELLRQGDRLMGAGEPVAILCHESDESRDTDWFMYQPIKPGSAIHQHRQQSKGWKTMPVYPHPAPAVDGAVIREAIRTMDDGERLDIFSEYCRCCGSNDPTCQCWNDE